MFHYPTKIIPLSLCTGGDEEARCPVSQDVFSPMDVVYVLKRDSARVQRKQSVLCLSAIGLKKLARHYIDRRFPDPCRRLAGNLLTLDEHYDAYIIQDDRVEEEHVASTLSLKRQKFLSNHIFILLILISTIFIISFIILYCLKRKDFIDREAHISLI